MGSPTCPTCGSDEPEVRCCADVRDREADRHVPWGSDCLPCENEWHAPPTPPAPADDAGGERRASTDALRRIARAAKPFAFYTRSLSENPGEYVMRVPRAEADEIQRAVDAIWGTDDYATDDAGGAEAMRHECAEIARRGAVVAYEQMADARNARRKTLTYADCMEAVGNSLSECESMIRALPLPPATGDATRVPAPRESASEDAVVEAARAYRVAWRAAQTLSADAPFPEFQRVRAERHAAREALFVALHGLPSTTALRGTRPEGHSPASGQGGV